jgi:hypothetical protein
MLFCLVLALAVGHTMGLSHDGVSGGSAYFAGQGQWAPIMGIAYYRPITQWSRGEYDDANNREDDIAIIRAKLGGVGWPTGAGASLETALPMAIAAVSANSINATASGILDAANEVVYYSFSTTVAGMVRILADGIPNNARDNRANLMPLLKVYDNQGIILGIGVGSSSREGAPREVLMGDTLTLNLPAGSYRLSIQSRGSENPQSSGYSAYGSLGQYYITATLPLGSNGVGPSPPPSPPVDPVTPPPSPNPSPNPGGGGGRRTTHVRKSLTRSQKTAVARVVVTDGVTGAPIPGVLVTIRWDAPLVVDGIISDYSEQAPGFPYSASLRTTARGVAKASSKLINEPELLEGVTFSVVGIAGQGLHGRGGPVMGLTEFSQGDGGSGEGMQIVEKEDAQSALEYSQEVVAGRKLLRGIGRLC